MSDNTIRVLIIHPDKSPEVIDSAEMADDRRRLAFLQSCVGGWIEAVFNGKTNGIGWTAFGNDEAKLIGMPENTVGTIVLTEFGWPGLDVGDFIHGPLVIVGWNPKRDTYHDAPDEIVQFAKRYKVVSF